MLVLLPVDSASASTKSNAEKMISNYKKGKYSVAKKYCKKLPKEASKKCIKKLSKKAKAAYRKMVKKYKLSSENYSDEYLWGYYLVDLDGDKKAELLVQHGTCEADVRTEVYTYKGGKAKQVGTLYSGHTGYYAYPGRAGMIQQYGHMGYESVAVTTMKKGKLQTTPCGAREIKTDYFPFRQLLDGHIRYGKNYNKSIDWKDLK